MNITEQKQNEGYKLSSGSVGPKDSLNYKQQDYNNFYNIRRAYLSCNLEQYNNLINHIFHPEWIETIPPERFL